MRNYATVSPMFWIRGSGKNLRGNPNAQIVALYLMTCSQSEMIGIYHIHPDTIARETGLTIESVNAGLATCAEQDIAHYDEKSELIWVPAMAKYQVGDELKEGKNGAPDRRIRGVVRAVAPYKGHRFYDAFLQRYGVKFRLRDLGGLQDPPTDPVAVSLTEGASKGLRRGFEGAANSEIRGLEGTTNSEISPYVPVPVPVPVPEFKPKSRNIPDLANEWLTGGLAQRTIGLNHGEPHQWPEVREVFADWRAVTGRPLDVRIADKRAKAVLAWLGAGYSRAELREVFELAQVDDWWRDKPLEALLADTSRLDALRQSAPPAAPEKPVIVLSAREARMYT